MSVEALQFEPYVRSEEQNTSSAPPTLWTGVAVYDGTQWASLCWELDVASQGATAQEALANLQDAVQATLEHLREQGSAPDPNWRVPDEEMRHFMLSHDASGGSAAGWTFAA